MTLRGSSNINLNSPDYFFHKAIIEIIETTTDNKNIEIKKGINNYGMELKKK